MMIMMMMMMMMMMTMMMMMGMMIIVVINDDDNYGYGGDDDDDDDDYCDNDDYNYGNTSSCSLSQFYIYFKSKTIQYDTQLFRYSTFFPFNIGVWYQVLVRLSNWHCR